MLRNEYENGRVVKQTLADGDVYAYQYSVDSNGIVRSASVRTPVGRVFNIEFLKGYSDSTVREQLPQPVAQKGLPALK
jgi:hypothetical protein